MQNDDPARWTNPGTKAPTIPRKPAQENPSTVSLFLAVCAYLPVLCLVPVLTTPDGFVRFHAKQGLALFVAECLAAMCLFIPEVGHIVAGVLFIVIATLICVSIAEVSKKRRWELPLFRGLSNWIDL